jgi:serine/threonine-protein kinase
LRGHFAVERVLGEGGMATVYLAREVRHARRVAIKVLRPGLAAVIGPERFLAEIKTTANLQHPNILALHDSGDADGLLYYVMPHVEGESLRQRLHRERQLSIDEAVRITTDVARALDYAHRQGVIHRDIKPANILLQEGRPLVADFGIAKVVNAAGAGRLTETGMSVGTPCYMSPEQATGEQDVTPATDTYSLACVLYEMLVEEPPFDGPTPQAILAKMLTDEPTSTLATRRAVPPNVHAAISKALERLPVDRFASTSDFAAALTDASFRYGPGVHDAGAATAGRWRHVAVGALAMLAVVSGLAAWGWTRPPASQPIARYVLGQSPDEALIATMGSSLALSPDGARLVYVGPGEGDERALWLKEREEPHARRIPGTDGAVDPFFYPDGRRIGFLRGGDGGTSANVVALESGELSILADDGFWNLGASPGPDGSLYLRGNGNNIVRLAAGANAVEAVTVPDPGTHHSFPEALPGGRGVVFTVDKGGYEYVRRDGALLAVGFDERSLEITGDPFRLPGTVAVGEGDGPGFGVDLAVSESGTLVYTAGRPINVGARRLVWVARDGAVTEIDPEWTAEFEGVALSPDGTRMAVTIGAQFDTDVWIKPLDRESRLRSLLTVTDGLNRRPAWTPDGRSVTFISDRAGGGRDLYSKRAGGSGSARVVLDLPVTIDEGFWSEDGEWLILRTGMSGEERDIVAWRAGTDPNDLVPVSTVAGVEEVAPALSPDGRFIAYVSNETGRPEVWVRAFPDVEAGRWQVSVDGGTEPVWAHSGRELFYKSRGNQVAVAVDTEGTFSRGDEVALFPLRDFYQFSVHRSYDVAADGERFVMIKNPEAETELVVVENFFEELRRAER